MNKSISELLHHVALALVVTLHLSGCGRVRYHSPDGWADVGFVNDLGRVERMDANVPEPSDSGVSDARVRAGDAPHPNCPTATGALGSGACPVGCSGGCEGGVCIIACGGKGSCISDLVCPSGWPCRVSCGGFRACTAARFDGSNASSLSIECAGAESCVAAAMICPTAGDCGVLCGGAMSCVSFSLACGPGRCAADCSGASATSFDQQCNGSSCCEIVNCG